MAQKPPFLCLIGDFMKNIERQRSLDKQKWLMSEEVSDDLSGEMTYCAYCEYAHDGRCTATQDERVERTLCATAFNRMKRLEKV